VSFGPPISGLERLVEAYDRGFQDAMLIRPDQVTDSTAIANAIRELPEKAKDLAETLLVGVGPGEPVPERFRPLIERAGDDLWRVALLLPRMQPSPGATIDPRHYAAACRINGSIVNYKTIAELKGTIQTQPHPPPSDARWDAIIIAAVLEADPPALTRDGALRRDVERRLISSLGGPNGDPVRWSLALAMARATGLARPSASRLYGFPESNPRPLTDPVQILEQEGAALAGQALLRILGNEWIPLEAMLAHLAQHCPEVLTSDDLMPWAEREARWFRDAADLLHRAGVIDATRGAEGIDAVRLAGPRVPRQPGFLLTPDRDILIAPWELPGPEYGRLCRLAPFKDGDVVSRHGLSREGVAADLAAGYEDASAWLAARSKTGLPPNVAQNLGEWAEQAVRITLFSGMTVLEEPDGAFTVGPEKVPSTARMLYYDEPPPARFQVDAGIILVPFGHDALTVRSVVSRLGQKLEPSTAGHRWRITPEPIDDPDAILDQLRRYHEGELPGELEAAVHAAAGRTDCRFEEAVVIHLPADAAASLQRDRVAGRFLVRALPDGQCVVDRRDLPALRARLDELGFRISE
jgi:hypothetical protein